MNRITQYLSLDDLLSVDDELFDFDGSKFDFDVGLHYHRARHFDPRPGKWLDESPVGNEGDDANLTRYVGLQSE